MSKGNIMKDIRDILLQRDKKLIKFKVISEICESDNINDAEWVKDKLKEVSNEKSKEPPPPKTERSLLKLP